MMIETKSRQEQLRISSLKMEAADSESQSKELTYQADKKSFWYRIMRRFRPNDSEVSRQEVIYDLKNNSELRLPVLSFEAIGDSKKTAQVLASEELSALGVSDSLVNQALPVLESIATESYNNYELFDPAKEDEYFQFYLNKEKKKFKKTKGSAITDQEASDLEVEARSEWDNLDQAGKMATVREWAVVVASRAGITKSSELVAAISGEAKKPQELLSSLSFGDLVGKIKQNLPPEYAAAAPDYDIEAIKSLVLSMARDQNNWLSLEEVAVIEKIISNPDLSDQSHDQDVQALMLVGMGIHLSWSAIQGPRSAAEQGDLLKKAQLEKSKIIGQDLIKKYSDLRVFRSANRTFAQMQVNKFKEGYGADSNFNKGMAMAIFEVLKDLVKIGLPVEAEVAA